MKRIAWAVTMMALAVVWGYDPPAAFGSGCAESCTRDFQCYVQCNHCTGSWLEPGECEVQL